MLTAQVDHWSTIAHGGFGVWKRIVTYLTLDVEQWAEESFGSCDLGDARRTRRAVVVAQQMAEHPDGSSPAQAENWADLKAMYRLFDAEDVTFTALASPHWQQTRSRAQGRVLLIGDTMETDFGIHRSVEGLGPTGDGDGRGFMIHNSLMVEAATGQIIGLAGQDLFYRQPAPEGENSYQALKRPRESEVWGRVIDLTGRSAADAQYIHVFDRGADNLDVFCHCVQQGADWVIRAAQLDRTVEDDQGRSLSLESLLGKLSSCGSYEQAVRSTRKRKARKAKLEVRFTRVRINRPKRLTPYQKSVDFQQLTQSVIEAREVRAPKGTEPLHWVLWTSLPVTSFDEARQIIEYYEQRWLIEELHKAIKTGCQLESRQYMEAHRLEAVAGVTSVLAVRLLQLKTAAKTNPQLPAARVVPRTWLKVLSIVRKRKLTTVRDFFRHLAGLGGFLMRKSDGDPGWITLWRGLDKLILYVRGYLVATTNCG